MEGVYEDTRTCSWGHCGWEQQGTEPRGLPPILLPPGFMEVAGLHRLAPSTLLSPSLPSAGFQGCYQGVHHLGGFRTDTYFSQFLRPEVRDPGVGRVGSSEACEEGDWSRLSQLPVSAGSPRMPWLVGSAP